MLRIWSKQEREVLYWFYFQGYSGVVRWICPGFRYNSLSLILSLMSSQCVWVCVCVYIWRTKVTTGGQSSDCIHWQTKSLWHGSLTGHELSRLTRLATLGIPWIHLSVSQLWDYKCTLSWVVFNIGSREWTHFLMYVSQTPSSGLLPPSHTHHMSIDIKL